MKGSSRTTLSAILGLCILLGSKGAALTIHIPLKRSRIPVPMILQEVLDADRPFAACLSGLRPPLEWTLDVPHVNVGDPASLQRKQNFGHSVMQQSIGLGSVKIKDAVERDSGEAFLNEHNKRLRNALFVKKPLAEDRKDVLDSRPGYFAEHVLTAKPVEIHLRGNRRIPMGQQCFGVGE
jgi:hypothetical protein